MRHLFIFWIAALLTTLNVETHSTTGIAWWSTADAQPSQGDELEDLDELKSSSAPKRGAVPKSGRPSSKAKGKQRLKVTQVERGASKSASSSEVYLRQIHRIESQVNELKEEIFRSRTRLAILKESVLASGLSGTELRIVHRNQMGANFKLERALYMLDGDPLYRVTDQDGELDQQEEIEIFNGPIQSGNHSLQVELVYRGNGFGVFSYLQSYRFTLNDDTTFRAEEGKRVTINVTGYERSGVTLELKDRPDIRFERDIIDLDEEADQAAQKSKQSPKTERKKP